MTTTPLYIKDAFNADAKTLVGFAGVGAKKFDSAKKFL